MPTLLFRSPSDSADAWKAALEATLPELDVRIHPDIGNPADIEYALIWAAPDTMLHDLPNLRVVFSLGAGIDHLLDGAVPDGIPIVRMIDPALTEGMIEYVLYQVLRHHRGMPRYESQQCHSCWQAYPQVRPGERTIGMLGLGELGSACAQSLVELNFCIHGYSRTRKTLPGVTCHAGADDRDQFLSVCNFLVCLLPLTDATRGILNADLFSKLRPGATLIHVGRGAQLVEQDLTDALASGQLHHAVLDVFAEEPLPESHPFWQHPAITVTPHVASLTNPLTGARRVVEGIRRDQAGEPLEGVVDPTRGY